MSSTALVKSLPAFGIRDLNGSETEPALVQISLPQYDVTIRSKPDAALTYLDDDDGEVITVGSALELEQRLDEPVSQRYKIRTQPTSISRRTSTEQLIHIFDIKNTNAVHSTWKQHQITSSQSPQPAKSSATTTSSSASSVLDLNSNFATMSASSEEDSTSHPSFTSVSIPANSQQRGTLQQNPLLKDLDAVLKLACEGLESQLGGFGIFLDATAEALQVAAQRTRETNTTPVENFLSGMKNIMTEVGGLGLDLLRGLNSEPIPAVRQAVAKKVEPSSSLSMADGSENDSSSSRSGDSLRKRVSFADIQQKSQSQAVVDNNKDKCDSPLQPDSNPIYGSGELVSEQESELWYSTNPIIPAKASSNSKTNSILDLETSDPDFCSRYPPLMSVRRAKTISDLHNVQSGRNHNNSAQPLQSALVRYPSVAQLERKRRSMDNCVEHHRVSPPHNDHQFHEWRPSAFTKRLHCASRYHPDTRLNDKPQTDKSQQSRSIDSESKTTHTLSLADLEQGDLGSSVHKSLPGSWPESKQNDKLTNLPRNESSEEYLKRNAAFDRAKQRHEAVISAISCRNTSPLNDPYCPTQHLRRAHTVTASNPAARLTKPFDPLVSGSGSVPNTTVPFRRHDAASLNPHLARYNSVASPYNLSETREQDHLPPIRSVIPPTRTLWDNFRHAPLETQQHDSTLTNDRKPMIQNVYDGSLFPRTTSEQSQPQPQPFAPAAQFVPVRNTNGINSLDHTVRYSRADRPDPTFTYPTPRPNRHGRAGAPAPPPASISKEDECVKQLKAMGYGMYDPNEAARLHVYAGATAGDVEEAIEMIEDDREAAKSIKEHRDAVNKVVENRDPSPMSDMETGDGSRWRLRTEE